MRKKLVPLIAIAFVVAVISTAVFYSLFASRLNGASTAPVIPQKVVVVAAREVPAGTVLSNSDLTAIPWAGASVPNGAYDSVERVAGKAAFSAILQGEPVLASRLVAKDGSAGSGIPEGMRAISVHVSDSSGVVSMLKPGYKVDVQTFASRSAKGPKDEVRTLLRGVTVLSSGPQLEQSSQGYFSAPVVTLLAGARDADELAQADSYARLRLTLRNPLEKTVAPPVPAPVANNPAVRSQRSEARFRVKAISLSDDGLATLASRLDSRIGSAGITITLTGATVSPATVAELIRTGDQVRVEAESLVTGMPRHWSSYELPKSGGDGSGRVRLLMTLPEGGHGIRIRPEVTGVWNGRVETRSLETELEADPGRVILISGLDRGDGARSNGKFQHLVLVVEPQRNAAPKSAD